MSAEGKPTKRQIGIGFVIVVLIVLFIVLIVKFTQNTIDNFSYPTAEEQVLEFFPQGSIPSSDAQQKALDWMASDPQSSTLASLGTDLTKHQLLERFVFATVYYATGGGDGHWKPWVLTDGEWLTEESVCFWNGLLCHQTKDLSVSYVELGFRGLTGSIPTELAVLSSIANINLVGNSLTGTIPSELAKLKALTEIDISGNTDINGTIPTEFGVLSNLKVLNFEIMSVTGTLPTELGQLSNMQILRLNQNKLFGTIPTEYGLLTKLTWLSMNTNDLTGTIPTEFGHLTTLEWLDLTGNNLGGSVPSELFEEQLKSEDSKIICYLGGNPNLTDIPADVCY